MPYNNVLYHSKNTRQVKGGKEMRFFGKKNAVEKIKTQKVSEITNADANVIHNHDDKNKLPPHKEEKVPLLNKKKVTLMTM